MTEAEQEQEQQSSVAEKDTKKEYDSDTDGDLFLYQIGAAISGDKSVIPKINFRRKHPQLGRKLSNHEIRLRKIEKTLKSLKVFLKRDIQRGMLEEIHKEFDKVKDCLVEDL
jgi:hypothetical protein